MSTQNWIKIIVIAGLVCFGASLLMTMASLMPAGESIPDIIASIHAGDL